jgi:cytochrome c peroxidase
MRPTSVVLSFLLCCMVLVVTNGQADALPLDRAILGSIAKQATPQEVLDAIPPAAAGESVKNAAFGLTQSQLIELGRFIFNNVTFAGNGRTCATCHPATNNFTIDPQFIATLPPNDPLFVAETNPNLQELENPVLMRSLGLICENLDGFDKPCVFRGVPHTLALRTSTTPSLQNPPNPGNILVPGTDPPVELANSTGWPADGAPIGDGARGELRLFAVGAVAQHFTKTLNRLPGVDLRVPSELELDALLEFQLSLGRQEDLVLASLTFKDPVVEFGKVVFQDQDPIVGGRCSLCHDNAGANRPPNNPNAGRNTIANTRVELTASTPAFLLQPDVIVVDGGFGKPPVLSPTIPLRDPPAAAGFGDGRFDAPPLIESAITPPFFHNNAVATIEAAVGFYCSPEFNQPAPIIILNTDKATSIAAFLRTVGSVELIDRAIQNDNLSINTNFFQSKDFINIALANSGDAMKVLKEGVYLLFPTAQQKLSEAFDLQQKALRTVSPIQRNALLNQVNAKLTQARNLIVE